MRHAGKAALVTGAGSGIGRAIALELGAQGANVAILDVNGKKAEEVRSELEDSGAPRTLSVQADVSDYSQVERSVAQVIGEFGRVDILINNASIVEYCYFRDLTEEIWDRTLAVNLKGTFNCTTAAIESMVQHEYGRIVSISSVAGITGSPRAAHYSAAKAGVIGLMKVIAKELGPQGITANAIAPGLIDTPLTLAPDYPSDIRERYLSNTPVGRNGRPEDIAYAASFLASEQASFITGQVLSPNGGYVI
jgi:2-hydroxycyclohexanecarboxyl-CoA dehydrogenase